MIDYKSIYYADLVLKVCIYLIYLYIYILYKLLINPTDSIHLHSYINATTF